MSETADSSEDSGRFGRTPYRADDLKEEYGTTESGRLTVTCPGCGNEWYPSSSCCVSRYAGDPFCPECGTDFRTETVTFQPKVKFWDVESLTHRKGTASDVTDVMKDVMELLDEADGEEAAEARALLQDTFGSLEAVERVREE